MNNNHLVTVAIPTFNRYNQLRTCLESVLNQSYPNIEIFISDNSCDVKTPGWLINYISTDNRIKYVKHSKNIGSIENHRYLLKNAKGDYIIFCHDDDKMVDDYVAPLMEHLRKNPSVSLVGPTCDRYLSNKFWYTYENWDSRGKTTFQRLYDLVPDAFYFHWRFEQYMYGVFVKSHKYIMSSTFKSQFHLFFFLSSVGELMPAYDVKLVKNTTEEDLKKYENGSYYKRYSLLRIFDDKSIYSIQQSLPISLQMIRIILPLVDLTLKQKFILINRIVVLFVRVSVRHEQKLILEKTMLLLKRYRKRLKERLRILVK